MTRRVLVGILLGAIPGFLVGALVQLGTHDEHVARRPPTTTTAAPEQPFSCAAVSEGWIVARESGGNPRAYNVTSGAGGLYQVMPFVWDRFGGYARAHRAPEPVQRLWFRYVVANGYRVHLRSGQSIPVAWEGCR